MHKAKNWFKAAPLAALFLGLAVQALAAAESSADDRAKVLAGIAPEAGSPLASVTADASWQRHARYFDGAWRRLDDQQLSKIRAWSEANIKETRPVVFYMFSGPDFLYADAFFSKASTYVLSGLEPVGDVPELSALGKGGLSRELSELETSLSSIISHSFFITKKMKTDLSARRVNGTLPILYVFLARSGKTITDVSFLTLDETGAEQPTGAGTGKNASRGVKIAFKSSDGDAHTLYYFSTDLSDGGVKNSGFLKFCEKLGTGDSFVKSASYLLHSDNFSAVRNFLLSRSAAIVQDDSGIPARYFGQSDWELRPFGRYLGPISIFHGRYQPKLKELFGKGRSASLDFGIGYRWRPRESNLLLAERREVRSEIDRGSELRR